jgi:isopenicillin-N N-acyltransferase-like protein
MGTGVLHPCSARVVAFSEYPLIRAAGSHRELGRQHGEQAADKIKSRLERITASNRLSRDQLRHRALAYRPLFEKYCPHLLDEIQGLGEGARVSLGEALAVNIEVYGDDLSRATPEGCTTYAIGKTGTSKRQILAGQNSDMDSGIPPLGYVLHLKPVNKPEVLIWTVGGLIGYHGMNSAGVAHFANDVGGGPARRWGMPCFLVKRMMLECDHVDQVVRLFEKVPQAANGNYVLCDGHGNILDIEATTAGPEILKDNGAGFLAHTNHFLCPRYATRENLAQSWKDSFPRLERMNSLIKAKLGSLSVEDMKKFLSDHSGYPKSICRHDGGSCTVASLIAEPAERCMHVAVGNPCENRYISYSM